MTAADPAPDPMAKPCKRCGQVHPRCSAHNQLGEPCQQRPARGFRVCHWHGAKSPAARAAADRRLALEEAKAQLALERPLVFGGQREIHPHEALLEAVWEASYDAAFWAAKVRELEADDHLVVRTRPSDGSWQVHPFVAEASAAQERKARFAALAVRAGVEERRVRLEEANAQSLFRALTDALQAAPLTPEQRQAVIKGFGARLRELSHR